MASQPRRKTHREVSANTEWPACGRKTQAWSQATRGGTRDDRMLQEIVVVIPPFIADRLVPIDAELATDMELAMREIAALDTATGGMLDALGVLLLRTESVASSKIENVQASLEDYARALHGIKTNKSAVSMVAATQALKIMIDDVGRTRRIKIKTITSSHATLMADSENEREYAGLLRDVQNWVGGSDYSPRSALYIPPPPETVKSLMADLILFSNRDDIPVLAQAAIAHAQFESIHPFTDGNGRIGRALINAILRRRGATSRVVVPLASALVAHRDRYFDLLGDYRDGDPRSMIASFAISSRIAAAESRLTASRLNEIPKEWRDLVGRIRTGSITDK
jgi:Fic family protein